MHIGLTDYRYVARDSATSVASTAVYAAAAATAAESITLSVTTTESPVNQTLSIAVASLS